MSRRAGPDRPGSRPAGARPRGTGRPARRRAGRAGADPARTAAADLLEAVRERDAYANLTLPGLLRSAALAGRDAAFATELGYGTLRWQGSLDAVLGRCVDRPLDAVDAAVRDLLRLGAYQLLHTRVPPHAAVSTTVESARARLGAGPARFVNAVLRRVAARDWNGWLDVLCDAEADPVARCALAHGHPRWVAAAIADALTAAGPAAAAAAGAAADPVRGGELAAALAADNRPEVHLVARPGRLGRGALLDAVRAAGAEARPTPWSPFGAVLAGGDPGQLAPVADGRAGVQDEGSQLVALALAGAPLRGGGDRWWLDLAAGPGGKAALLSGCAAEHGAALLAVDPAAARARLAARALRGGAAPAERSLVVRADGQVPPWPAGRFDRVLLDAPCSGLGALRRRPELRWRRQPGDIPRLVALQRALLAAALAAARPGGVVAYVTCSPHLAETRNVVDDVLAAHPWAEHLDARAALPRLPDLGPGPDVQLWPHRHGTDAMFLALLRA